MQKRKRVNASKPTQAVKRYKSKSAPRFKLLKSVTTNSRAQSVRTVLSYCDTFSLNPGAGVAGAYVFAANGLYDPDISGVGHQVNGFDQYMALYNEYLVLGSTITIWLRNTDTANPIMWGIFLEDLATTDLDWRKYVETGNGVYTIADFNGTGGSVKKLTHQCDVSKFSSQSIMEEDGFTGTASANPDDTHFYHIVAVPFDNGSDVPSLQGRVEIKYDVMFRDPTLSVLS